MDLALIDTSILLEPFTKYERGKKSYRNAALTLLKYSKRRFNVATSISILGELYCILNKKENLIKGIENKREKMIGTLQAFFDECEFLSLDTKTIHLAHRILKKDKRLKPLDVLHFASAISGKCQSFIFIDEELANNEVIKRYSKKYGVSLAHYGIEENEDKGRVREDITCIESLH